MHIVKADGSIYDLQLLQDEITAFNLQDPKLTKDQLTLRLAIHDLKNDFALLDDKWENFLTSKKY